MRRSPPLFSRHPATARQRRPPTISTKLAICLATVASLSLTLNSSHAASATWGANGGTLWYTGSNWVGGAYPGIQSGSGGNSSDIATFTSAATATTFGIDMGMNSLAVGAISIDSSRTIATNIGNNSHSIGGHVDIGGTTINGVANVIFRNNSTGLLTFQSIQAGGQGLALILGDSGTAENVIMIDNTGGITISAAILGPGNNLTLGGSGTGVLTLSGANTYDGTTTVTSGTLVAGTNSASGAAGAFGQATSAVLLGDTAASSTGSASILIGGAFNVGRDITVRSLGAGGTQTATIGGNTAASSTFSGAINLNRNLTLTAVTGGTVNLTKSINNATGTNTVFVTGAGTSNVVLNNATINQFAPTTFSVNSGKLSLGASDQIANATAVNVNGGTLDIADKNDTVGAVTLTSGNINGTSGTLTGSSYAVQSGNISAKLGGSGALTKSTGGTVVLSGSSTGYTGATAINTGTLIVDGSLINSAVTVNGGTLGGIGTTGSVTVNSGNLAPGDSPGILHVSGNLSLAMGSNYLVDINGTTVGTQYDQTAVTGNVSLGNATLITNFGYSPVNGHSFMLIDNLGSNPVTGQFNGWAEGATIGGFTISYLGGDGNDVVLSATAVPEPSTWVAGILASIGLLAASHRRFRTARA